MTTAQIMENVKAGKMTVEEATKAMNKNIPVTRVVGVQFASCEEFLKAADTVKLSGDGLDLTLTPKQFSTGSYGWASNGKLVVKLADGKPVRVQGSINLVVIGSKPE